MKNILSLVSIVSLIVLYLVKLFVVSYLVKLFYHSNQFLFKDQSQSQALLDTSAFCNVFVLWQYSNSMPCNLQNNFKKGFCFILMSVCLAWNVECLCVIGARYAFRRNIYLDVTKFFCLLVSTHVLFYVSYCSAFNISYFILLHDVFDNIFMFCYNKCWYMILK